MRSRSSSRGSRRPLTIGLVTLSLLAAACLGRSPETRLFTLGAETRDADATSASEISVLVGPLRFPRYLERPQIVRRLGGGELEIEEFHRWAGGFEDNVSRALAKALAERLSSDRVLAHPADPPHAIDFRVAVRFDEFVVSADDILRLRAVWSLEGATRHEEARLGRTDRDLPTGSDDFEALVEAHQEAIEILAEAIANEIESALPAETSSERELR